MFTRSDDKITTSQGVIFVAENVLGAGILTLPRVATEQVQTPDAWLSVLLSSLIIMLMLYVMAKLCQTHPGETIFEFSQKIAGALPGKLFSLVVIFYFLLIASFEIRVLAEVTLFFLLENTPIWAIIVPFIWTAAYLISGGINCIARLFQIVFPASLLILLLSLLLSLRLFDFDNLRPFLGEGLAPVIKGLKPTLLSFAGCEVVLTLIGHLQNPHKAVKMSLAGISIPVILYLCTSILVVGGLSTSAVLRSIWPTIDLLRSYEIIGMFFERFEFPFLVIWIMQMFCNFTSNYFVVSMGIFKITSIKLPIILFSLMPIIYIGSQIPKSLSEMFILGDTVGIFSIIVFITVTLPLGITYIIRKKGLNQNV